MCMTRKLSLPGIRPPRLSWQKIRIWARKAFFFFGSHTFETYISAAIFHQLLLYDSICLLLHIYICIQHMSAQASMSSCYIIPTAPTLIHITSDLHVGGNPPWATALLLFQLLLIYMTSTRTVCSDRPFRLKLLPIVNNKDVFNWGFTALAYPMKRCAERAATKEIPQKNLLDACPVWLDSSSSKRALPHILDRLSSKWARTIQYMDGSEHIQVS